MKKEPVDDAAAAAVQKVKKEEKEDEEEENTEVSDPSTSGHDSVSVVQGEQATAADTTSDHKALKAEPCETEVYFPLMTPEDPSVDPLSVPVKEESPTSSKVKKEENNEDGTAELVTPDPLLVPECLKAEAESVLPASLQQQCVKTEPSTEEQGSGDICIFHGSEDARNPCQLGGETKEMHLESIELQQPTSSASTFQPSNHISATAVKENTSATVEVAPSTSVLVYDSDDFGAMDVDSEDQDSSTEVGVKAQCSSSSLAAVHCETERRGPLSSQGSASAVFDADESISSEDHRWKCICDRSFRNRSDLDKHQKTHLIDGKWKCCFCDKKFTRLCTLVGHRKTHSRQEESYETLDGSAQESSSDIPHSPRVERVENISPVTSAPPTNANENWVCNICDKNFSFPQGLWRHRKTHFIEGRWKCCFCDQAFTNVHGITDHRRTHCSQEESSVTLDGAAQESFSDIPDSPIVEPVENISPDTSAPQTNANENWVCNVCDKNFSFTHDLWKHRKTHFIEGKWRCCFCDQAFTKLSGLISHKKRHFRQKESSETLDGSAQELSSDIPDSPRVEPVENISPVTSAPSTNANDHWVCYICDKNFSCSHDLWKHRKTHFIEGKWRCCFCDQAFTNLRGITNHRRTHSRQEESSEILDGSAQEMSSDIPHSPTVEPVENISPVTSAPSTNVNENWVCNICDKNFSFPQGLWRHRKTHFIEGRWKCCFCDQAFTNLRGITNHRRTHSRQEESSEILDGSAQEMSSDIPHSPTVEPVENISPVTSAPSTNVNENWVCNLCDKNFSCSQDLWKHRKTHFIEGKWRCCLCDKAFADLRGITNHRKTHSRQEESSYISVSQIIEPVKNISSVSSVIPPLIKFSDENDPAENQEWMCKICDKSFRIHRELKNHLKSHFIEGKWRCCFCDKSFSHLCRITSHRKTHFRNEKNYEELEIVAQPSSSNMPLSGKVMPVKNISSATNEISTLSKDIDSPLFDANETSSPGYQTLKCSECNKYLNLCRNLKEQLKINFGTDSKSRKWKMNLCDTYFSYLCQLASHVKTHFTVSDSAVELKAAAQHSSADLLLSGKVVSVETVSSASLQDIDIPPIDTEKDEIGNSAMKDQNWLCNICDKNFLSFPALYKHRRVHFNSENHMFNIFDETVSNLCQVNHKKILVRESVVETCNNGPRGETTNQSGEEQYSFRKRSKRVNLYTAPPHDDDDDDDGDDEEKDGKNRVADDRDYTMDHDDDDDGDTQGSDYMTESEAVGDTSSDDDSENGDDGDTGGSDYMPESGTVGDTSSDDASQNVSGKSKAKKQKLNVTQRLSSPSSRADTVRTILNRNGGRGSDCFCVNRACTSITEQMLAHESSMPNATNGTVNKSLVITRQSPPSQHNATVSTPIRGEKLECFKCKEMMTTVEEAMEHAKKHFTLSAEDEGNLCPICDKRFGKEDTILDHISLHWPHKCDDCGRRYATSLVLGFHKAKCYKEDRGCPLCEKEVKDPTKLSEHLRNVMKSTCSVCGECYINPYKLKAHIMLHFGFPIPYCKKSGRDYYNKGGLKSHICKRCNENFRSRRYLMKHRKACKRTIDKIKKVRKKQRLQCDKCKKSYSTRYHLCKHIFKFCYKSMDKNFECDQCNEWFAEELLLRDHIRRVHSKHQQCEICGKTFKKIYQHMKTHTSERNFKCADCGDAFRQLHHLRNHMRKHTGERPYICEQCGERFKTTGHLIYHREIHKPPGERRRVICKNAPITFAKKFKD